MDLLTTPGYIQRVAFGTKVQEVFDGKGFVHLDNIQRVASLRHITIDFLTAVGEEANYDENIPSSNLRCTCIERDTFRRCLLPRDHKANGIQKCKFTPKGSICKRSIEECVKCLTGGQIKSLSGLDDTKELKGRKSFEKLRSLADKYCHNPEDLKRLKEGIDDTEIFYQTDFAAHLHDKSDYACACLTCGFSGVDGTECRRRKSHKNSCGNCSLGYAIISEIKSLMEVAQKDTSTYTAMQLSKLANDTETIINCKTNLDTLRSHLARHFTESLYDNIEISKLDGVTALVISDFKNKILDSMFRENMQAFFGKNGSSDLGFMRILRGANGELEATFYHFVSDDKLQDATFVISAKYEMYTNHLPEHIQKVKFRTDGAANLISTIHNLVQPMWKIWTGVEEEVLKHCPSGDGKTQLDGNFGRAGEVFKSAVNLGFSFNDAKTIVEAATINGGGGSATTFGVFLPGRKLTLRGKISIDIFPKSVLRSILQADGSLI